jgi:hypothetical protein
MIFQKHILSIAAVVALGTVTVFAQTSSKAAAPKNKPAAAATKTHVAQGSVVTATDDSLTLKSGKKDMNFKLNPTTQKPTSMTPGTSVTVNYHDEGNQHIANSIQLAPTKSNATAAKPPASK